MARLPIFSLIFVLFSAYQANANYNETDLEEIVPFELVEGMILVAAEYDGQIGDFVFDTGSSQILLHQLESQRKNRVELYTSDGIVWANRADISSIQLGKVHIRDISAIGMDLTQISVDTKRDIKGVIGWSILGDRSITIDYKNQNIHIGAVKDMSTLDLSDYQIIKLEMKRVMDDLPIISVSIRNQSYNFAFDTGAPINVIDGDVADVLFDEKRTTDQMFVDDILLNDVMRIEKSLMRSADLRNFNFDASKKLDGILSVNSLGAEIVVIDKETNRIFLFWNKSTLNSPQDYMSD